VVQGKQRVIQPLESFDYGRDGGTLRDYSCFDFAWFVCLGGFTGSEV
jgi:hypothetical protein